MVVITCAFPNCNFETADVPEAVACVVLQSHTYSHAATTRNAPAPVNLGPKLNRPTVDIGVSPEEWSVFTRRWKAFKEGCSISDEAASVQLFQCTGQALGDSLLQADAETVSKPVDELLLAMRQLAVIPVATGVLRSEFMAMHQMRDEKFRAFAARARGKADICAFTTKCSCGLKVSYTDHMIRDTLLSGISDSEIRREMMGMDKVLSIPINDIIALVEIKEMARNAVPSHDVSAVSTFKRKKSQSPIPRDRGHIQAAPSSPNWSQKTHCPKCNRLFNRYREGPRGWNTTPYSLCLECFRSSRHKNKWGAPPKDASVGALCVAPTVPQIGTFASTQTDIAARDPMFSTIRGPHHTFQKGHWTPSRMREHPTVRVDISMDDSCHQGRYTSVIAQVTAIADTGAQINVWSLKNFVQSGFGQETLVPAPNLIAANRSTISITGAFRAIIRGTAHGCNVERRCMIYISPDVDKLYLSHDTLLHLGALSPKFPTLGEHQIKQEMAHNLIEPEINVVRLVNGGCTLPSKQLESCTCPQRGAVPAPPTKLPFPCTPENNDKMANWLLQRYAASTFNTCPHRALHCMAGPPIEIHVDPNAKPVAVHTPASIPLHWQEKVHADLLRDEALGILEKVPHGEPTTWCHRMVITRKNDGSPRRTVDLSPLNKFCQRETFASEAPFQLSRRVPGNTWKSVTDAWNGYHSVPLRPSDRHLTTFITPFGRWRYTRAPQGFLSSGDGYNRRFNTILTDFVRKERCVDDTVFYDSQLEEHWWRTIKFLTLVGRAGIVLNPDKFQFAQRTVDFAGFRISEAMVEPLPKYLLAIQEFPVPNNITDIRSWFGLINQVGNYAQLRDLMAPFKPFLSPKHKFEWSQELDSAFAASKSAIVDAIRHGVEIFDPCRRTCLRPDWSNKGIGYFLLQKHCVCASTIPDCCSSGWKVTLAGSRFLSSAERRYAPIEGEALAVAWGLEQTKYFTQGCDNLVIVTDHKPLVKIFGDRTLDEITNTRLFRLKQRTLMWRFDIAHLPGTTNCAADAASRHPVSCDLIAVASCAENNVAEMALVTAIQADAAHAFCLQWPEIVRETAADPNLSKLMVAIETGFTFPNTGDIRPYLPYRDGFFVEDDVILYHDRIVVPPSLRPRVLSTLHAGHQGVSAMERRARAIVFWPGMTNDIHAIRDSCTSCNRNAPSQAAPPPTPCDPPATPFEKIFADYFDYGGRHFLVIGDRFSGWSDVFATPSGSSAAGAAALTQLLRSYFATFGVPEEISTDGGPEFTAAVTELFLKNWGVQHRISSSYFPQSNGRAEVAVKTVKRLLMTNVSPNGDLNNDSFLRALLQLRNTPDPDCDISPAEIVFGHPLRDAFGFVNRLVKFSNRHIRRTWRDTWKAKEDALRLRAGRTDKALSQHTRPLRTLQCGKRVFIQNQNGNYPRKWDKVGMVVETLPHDKYVVKVDGSGRITKRNRRFLRVIPHTKACADPIPPQPNIIAHPQSLPSSSFAQPPETDYCPPHPPHHEIGPSPEIGESPMLLLDADHSPPALTCPTPASSPKLCEPQHSPEPPKQPLPFDSVEPTEPTSGVPHIEKSPVLRRSTRSRRPALDLDASSGQWVIKGSSS